jgi:hypothetical protein
LFWNLILDTFKRFQLYRSAIVLYCSSTFLADVFLYALFRPVVYSTVFLCLSGVHTCTSVTSYLPLHTFSLVLFAVSFSPFLQPRTRMVCCIEPIPNRRISYQSVSVRLCTHCTCRQILHIGFVPFDYLGSGSSKKAIHGTFPVCIYWHVSPCRCHNHNPLRRFPFLLQFLHLEGAKL